MNIYAKWCIICGYGKKWKFVANTHSAKNYFYINCKKCKNEVNLALYNINVNLLHNCKTLTKFTRNVKIVNILQLCQNLTTLSKFVKIVRILQICQKMSKCQKMVEVVEYGKNVRECQSIH